MKPTSIYCGDVPDDFGTGAGENNPAPETGTAARQLAFIVKLQQKELTERNISDKFG
jgi:hypothetical protein